MRTSPEALPARRLVAEAGGSAFLLLAISGAATLAGRVAPANDLAALIALSVAVGGALLALTVAFGRISGGYFNPVLTVASLRDLGWRTALLYVSAQILGALLGVGVASVLHGDPVALRGFDLAPLQLRRVELVTAFGLAAVATACADASPFLRACVAAGYTVAALWATGTPCFGNPAVFLAGVSIAPAAWSAVSIVGTLLAQLAGAFVGAFIVRWMLATGRDVDVHVAVVPLHASDGEEYAHPLRARVAAARE